MLDINGLYFNYDSSHSSEEVAKRELMLFLKKAFKQLYQKFKGQKDKPTIQVLAETLNDLLPTPGKQYCNNNPIYLKHLTSSYLLSAWKLDNQEEEAVIGEWIDKGILQHVAFPEPSVQPELLPLSEGLVTPPSDYKLVIAQLLNSKQLWRLFVGANMQALEAPENYEQRQPGVLAAMQRAFFLALKTLDKPLDFNILIDIHQACVKDVKGLNDQAYHPSSPYRDTDEEVGFSISMAERDCNKSIAGYREACLYPHAGTDYKIKSSRISTTLYGKTLFARINEILKTYNEQMELASNDKQKQLYLMMQTLGTIERIHPFRDANCRAICVVGLLRELIRHKFSPVILDNPNRLDCFSSAEMIRELNKGYANLQKVLTPAKQRKKNVDDSIQKEKNRGVLHKEKVKVIKLRYK